MVGSSSLPDPNPIVPLFNCWLLCSLKQKLFKTKILIKINNNNNLTIKKKTFRGAIWQFYTTYIIQQQPRQQQQQQ